jgi:hypothetical protein
MDRRISVFTGAQKALTSAFMKYFILATLLLAFLPPLLRADPVAEPFKHREGIEWVNITIPSADNTDLPRILLIGDSITANYYDDVCRDLQGKAYVVRLATSFFVSDPMLLNQVKSMLAAMKFDVIQFHNGLHGWDHRESEFEVGLPVLLQTIRDGAPNAKVIWATITPMSRSGQLDQPDDRMPRVEERNRIALDLMTQEGVPVDDLYTLMKPHPDLHIQDGTHWTSPGENLQASQVADQVMKALISSSSSSSAPTAPPQ